MMTDPYGFRLLDIDASDFRHTLTAYRPGLRSALTYWLAEFDEQRRAYRQRAKRWKASGFVVQSPPARSCGTIRSAKMRSDSDSGSRYRSGWGWLTAQRGAAAAAARGDRALPSPTPRGGGGRAGVAARRSAPAAGAGRWRGPGRLRRCGRCRRR